jgi:isocitrate dehydrogenase
MATSAIETVESGVMTGDRARIASPAPDRVSSSEEFIDAIARTLAANLR